ncbi:MAG: thermonuclease family protein [Ignavibacteriales bacterium]|nr:thermonuclease family protein [Ignavibacteriales bacterium]
MYCQSSVRKKFFLNEVLRIVKIITILISLLISFNTQFAQKVRITKILDSNLFETSDSVKIKLAGVDVPNINHPNKQLREIGIEAFEYAKSNLINRPFDININQENFIDSSYYLVTLIRVFPLATKDYTEEYLTKGFGKYIYNLSELDSVKYMAAENEAKEDKDGIWNFNTEIDEVYDNPELSKNITDEFISDTLYAFSSTGSFLINLNAEQRIAIEIIAAPSFGFITGVLGGLAGGIIGAPFGTDGWENLGYIVIGFYTGYLLGNSIAVYNVAKYGNRQVDFGGTLFSGIIGAAVGLGIAYSRGTFFEDEIYIYAPLVLPGIASILYANLIAPKKELSEVSLTNYHNEVLIRKDFITHQDIYNSKKLIEINLIRINF